MAVATADTAPRTAAPASPRPEAADPLAWAGGRAAWWDGVQLGVSALLTEAAHRGRLR